MIPVDRDTSVQHNQFTKSLSLPNNANDLDFSIASSSSSSASSRLSASNSPKNELASPSEGALMSPEEESKKSIEDFLGKIDSTLAKTKKFVKNR